MERADDVIDDVARPAVRIAGLRHEVLPRLRAAGDTSVAYRHSGAADEGAAGGVRLFLRAIKKKGGV
jgi:hypothetical protein